ncbi:MAG: glycosyltransferase [Alphaproteobacteria bacterium]|nr:glycosyltransferase [Alphaproteobacteria bacterium]
MKKLLVVKSDILPLSETFIKEQILSCMRWKPRLIGRALCANGLALDNIDTALAPPPRPRLINKILWKVAKKSLPDPDILRFLEREQASLVHVHFGMDLVGWWPELRRLGLPVVTTLHGYDINTHRAHWEETGDAWVRRYPRRLLDIARHPSAHFIAVGEAVRERAIAFGIPSEKLAVKYIGIDTSRFAPRADQPIAQRKKKILCVGRMVENKGGCYLIEAFARVRHEIPDAELTMIGAGELLESCKELAARLNVPVRFTGGTPHDQIIEELHDSRVFCLPSITIASGASEGMPIVVMEAQACGIPVVTSARGGATEGIIDGVTGFAFAERDVDALAAHLVRFLTDDDLAEHMSKAAREHAVAKFDLVACTARLEDYYDEIAYLPRQASASNLSHRSIL